MPTFPSIKCALNLSNDKADLTIRTKPRLANISVNQWAAIITLDKETRTAKPIAKKDIDLLNSFLFPSEAKCSHIKITPKIVAACPLGKAAYLNIGSS